MACRRRSSWRATPTRSRSRPRPPRSPPACLPAWDWTVCYQSRVGPLKWIGPSTDDEIRRAGGEGKGVMITPIAFVSEHVETLVELDHEYAELAEEVGCGALSAGPALGVAPVSSPVWRQAVTRSLGQARGNHPAACGWRCGDRSGPSAPGRSRGVTDFLVAHFNLVRGLHILAVIAFMAGMLYLPRLFVYHTEAAPGSRDGRDLQGHGAPAAAGHHQSGDDRLTAVFRSGADPGRRPDPRLGFPVAARG